MRHLGLAGLLWWAVTAQASPTWNGLWRTPDQRAQQLLQQGKAAEASRLFQDPRRKAYAELQAGNFSQAAQDFHAFNDTDGQYNRGNALARAGHLQQAIQAYDAALAHDPDNADARHNRELVARALQKQPLSPSPSASGKGQQGGKSPPGQSGQTQRGQNPSDSGKQNMHGGAQNGQISLVSQASQASLHPVSKQSASPVRPRCPAATRTRTARNRIRRRMMPRRPVTMPRPGWPSHSRRRRPPAARPANASLPKNNGCAAFRMIRAACCGANS
ncbi:MAG: hypothetical protein ABT22_09215 [Thiobacillus sp. SCN 64-317]|nr:MAG: hypothetical protein ABT22_09215 [Thiobacillus sp. SCN 64-317]